MVDDPDREFGASKGTHAAGNLAAGGGGQPDPARAAKVGASRAAVEAAMGDLVAGIEREAGGEQVSMMLDEMDEQLALFSGPVKHVANTLSHSRARGRPKGSQNKNSFADTLMRMGFRHPGLNLAAMANADPYDLAVELAALDPVPGMTGLQVLQLQITKGGMERSTVIALVKMAQDMIGKANSELMPYFESKRPTEIAVDSKVMGVMLIGEMAAQQAPDTAFIDLTNVDSPT